MFAFLLVFVRCSAMLFTSPVFGAQSTPLPVRIMTTLAMSAALTLALQPKMGPPPETLYALASAVLAEAAAGAMIGLFTQLVMQAVLMAGSLIDTQIGLGISQQLNPLTGVSVTVIAQYKYMLGVVIFLAANGHHMMLQAFARSYELMPPLGSVSVDAFRTGYVELLGQASLLALTIAAPVLAVSLVADAALGVISRAVPQMQAIMVGMPAKLGLGILATSLALPALVTSVQSGVESAMRVLMRAMGG